MKGLRLFFVCLCSSLLLTRAAEETAAGDRLPTNGDRLPTNGDRLQGDDPKTPVEEVESILTDKPARQQETITVCTMEYRPVRDKQTGKEFANPCVARAAGVPEENIEFLHQ